MRMWYIITFLATTYEGCGGRKIRKQGRELVVLLRRITGDQLTLCGLFLGGGVWYSIPNSL